MALVLQPDGRIADGPIPPGGVKVLALHQGRTTEVYVQTGSPEVAFPSYISSATVYQPTENLPCAGVSLVNGRVVLDVTLREVAGNV